MPRVLITEDNIDIQRIFHKAFEHAGFEVAIAVDGLKSMEMLDEALPDVLVLDINMPGATGIEVIEHLRQRDCLDKVHIIVATGNTVAADSIDDDLIDLVLVKPISPLDLVVLSQRLISVIRN